VVEEAREVVGEELLGTAELVVGSVGLGNNRRRLPLVGCSWRNMTAGEPPFPGFASQRCVQVLGVGGAQ
jgi:hypothetical protein